MSHMERKWAVRDDLPLSCASTPLSERQANRKKTISLGTIKDSNLNELRAIAVPVDFSSTGSIHQYLRKKICHRVYEINSMKRLDLQIGGSYSS